MSSFLSNIESFRGTGDVNEQGQTLEAFLEKYDADKYPKPSVTADILVFSYQKDKENLLEGIKLLMIKRRNHPSIGYWALPGGFAEMREDLIDTARRELEEETRLTNIPLVQLYTFGEVERDPRDRIITTAYLALIEDGTQKAEAGDDAADAKWWNLKMDLISTKEEDDIVRKEYQLCLCLQGKDDLTARVTEVMHKNFLIQETEYVIEDSNGIAFDHARYIVRAYTFLEKQLKR